MTFSIGWTDIPPQSLSDVGVSQQGEYQRRDRLEMGMLISRLYSILVEPIRIEQLECARPNVSARWIENPTKRVGNLRVISARKTRTGGYRLPEAALRREPQSGHYARMVATQRP
jgi:hypothetical protein